MRGITIRPLYHGSMHVDRDLLLSGDPAMTLTRSDNKKNKVWCEAPSFTYLIDHPEGRLLFDATISKHWEEEWLPDYKELAPYDTYKEEELFENTLKSMKLGPEEIDHVFLSHLHCDHAGNARLFAGTDTKIYIHDNEFRAAAARVEDGEFFLRVDYDIPGARFTLLPGDVEIMKDVFAISLPGHTAGTMGLMVHTEHCGTFILTSDASYLKESYDHEVGSVISRDLVMWKESMAKLKMLARAYNATVIFGHDHRVGHEGACPIGHEAHLRTGKVYD